MMIRVLRESRGTAVTVTDAELLDGVRDFPSTRESMPAPKGGSVDGRPKTAGLRVAQTG